MELLDKAHTFFLDFFTASKWNEHLSVVYLCDLSMVMAILNFNMCLGAVGSSDLILFPSIPVFVKHSLELIIQEYKDMH